MEEFEFKFTAHKVNTKKIIEIVVRLEDDGGPWADLCDEAYERACGIAAKRLNCRESQVEVVSE